MAYQKTVWATDDDITSEKLNKIENELEALDSGDGDEGGSGGVEPVFILLDTSGGDHVPVGWSDANYDTKADAVVSAAMNGSPVFFKVGEYDSSEETIPDDYVTDIIGVLHRTAVANPAKEIGEAAVHQTQEAARLRAGGHQIRR